MTGTHIGSFPSVHISRRTQLTTMIFLLYSIWMRISLQEIASILLYCSFAFISVKGCSPRTKAHVNANTKVMSTFTFTVFRVHGISNIELIDSLASFALSKKPIGNTYCFPIFVTVLCERIIETAETPCISDVELPSPVLCVHIHP